MKLPNLQHIKSGLEISGDIFIQPLFLLLTVQPLIRLFILNASPYHIDQLIGSPVQGFSQIFCHFSPNRITVGEKIREFLHFLL